MADRETSVDWLVNNPAKTGLPIATVLAGLVVTDLVSPAAREWAAQRTILVNVVVSLLLLALAVLALDVVVQTQREHRWRTALRNRLLERLADATGEAVRFDHASLIADLETRTKRDDPLTEPEKKLKKLADRLKPGLDHADDAVLPLVPEALKDPEGKILLEAFEVVRSRVTYVSRYLGADPPNRGTALASALQAARAAREIDERKRGQVQEAVRRTDETFERIREETRQLATFREEIEKLSRK